MSYQQNIHGGAPQKTNKQKLDNKQTCSNILERNSHTFCIIQLVLHYIQAHMYQLLSQNNIFQVRLIIIKTDMPFFNVIVLATVKHIKILMITYLDIISRNIHGMQRYIYHMVWHQINAICTTHHTHTHKLFGLHNAISLF